MSRPRSLSVPVSIDARPYRWPVGEPGRIALVELGGREQLVDEVAAQRRRSLGEAIGRAGWIRLRTQPTPSPGDVAIGEHLGAFVTGELDLVLRRLGVSHLILVGERIDHEVHSSAREANDRGYDPLVIIDACGARDDQQRRLVGETLVLQGGIVAAVSHTSAVLEAVGGAYPAS